MNYQNKLRINMNNSLDGLTILRSLRAFKSGGGIEQHIDNLDYVLLKRNRVKILKMYLETNSKNSKVSTRRIGKGFLTEIPINVKIPEIYSASEQFKKPVLNYSIPYQIIKKFIAYDPYRKSNILTAKAMFWEYFVYNPVMLKYLFYKSLKKYYPRPGIYQVIDIRKIIRKILKNSTIDLLIMHHLGTTDSAEIIDEAQNAGVPFIYINHYSNALLTHFAIREQIANAAGIAGVCDWGLPKRLKKVFFNVSSGLDTTLFNPDNKNSQPKYKGIPIIFYPARITPNKGQLDLIKALKIICKMGLRAKIVFAGRVDSPDYEKALIELVNKNNCSEDVLFLGQINQEKMIEWYRASSVIAFPTYHQEGLSRILMEAQAMKVPPVAYSIGGNPKALINGETGFLVKTGDVKSFSQKLFKLLSDDTTRRMMGEKGRRFVLNHFSNEAMAKRHEQLYINSIQKNQEKNPFQLS